MTTTEGIPTGITEEHKGVNQYLPLTYKESDNNKEMAPTEGIQTGITDEHQDMNEYLTLIYKESDNNREMTPTDTEQQFSR